MGCDGICIIFVAIFVVGGLLIYICILSFDHEIARTDRVCGCELCILGIFLYLLFVSVVGSGVCVPQTHSLPSQLLNSVVITSCCFDLTVGCS